MKKFIALFWVMLSVFAFTSCSMEESSELIESSVSQTEFVADEETDASEDITEAVEADTTEQTEASAEEQTSEEQTEAEIAQEDTTEVQEALIDEYGTYTTKEDVALYIYTYGRLPENFITKKEAQSLGWPGGSLEPYAPGKCIGGSYFGNYEGLLPEADGRDYYECDIDTLGADKRGAKRIVYSNDGLIYYTDDHYESFELLYGEE